ncbi:MAG: TolC family protein [Elusimicrobiota bacterium]|nr:MAG: TolC family protein [Elusimicrobiota bacterium]
MTFEDLPRLVAEKNRAVSGAERLVDSARARTGSLGRSFLPTLSGEAGAERFKTGTHDPKSQPYGHLEAKVNVFRGGRDRLEESGRELQIQAAGADARRTAAAELAGARSAYWRLVSTREKVRIVVEALEQNEKTLAVAARRVSRGLATDTDRLEFEIHRSQLREERESLTHAALLLEIELSAALGMPLESKFRTPETVGHEHDESLLSAPFEPGSHPDASDMAARGKALGVERLRAGRWWQPELDLYGGYYLYTLREREYQTRRDRLDKAVGARLNFFLFDGLRSTSEAAALRLREEGVGRQRVQRELALDAEVRVAKEDLKHDHELVHYAEERIAQGSKYLARTLDEYERGVKNSPDALGAAQRALSYKMLYADRRRDYQLTKTGLLALLGR